MVSDIQLRNAYALLVENTAVEAPLFSELAEKSRRFVEWSLGDLECLLHSWFSADERILVKNLLCRTARYERMLAFFAVGRALVEATGEWFWFESAKEVVLDTIYGLWEEVLR